MLKTIKRKGPSPVKPLKLAKQIIRERTFDKEAEEEPNEQEPNVTSEITLLLYALIVFLSANKLSICFALN